MTRRGFITGLGATLALVGCGRSPIVLPEMAVNNFIIQGTLMIHGARQVYTPDPTYVLPTKGWLEDFAYALEKEQRRRGLTRFEEHVYDCDDFARFGQVYAAECYYKERTRVPGTSVAFGSIWYKRTNGTGHAINIAITPAGDDTVGMVFLEPQGCFFTSITLEEMKDSIVFF
jgi:hypothetical protein